MRRAVLSSAALALGGLALVQGLQLLPAGFQMRAFAATGPQSAASAPALLDGCGDVPEALALAEELRLRGLAVDRGIEALDGRRAEIAAAEARLAKTLGQLRAAKEALGKGQAAVQTGSEAGISRLIAVYDAMKPAEAAEVLAALPPDFGAEILARVQPETGARIIAALEPEQATILSARLGATRTTKD